MNRIKRLGVVTKDCPCIVGGWKAGERVVVECYTGLPEEYDGSEDTCTLETPSGHRCMCSVPRDRVRLIKGL